MRNKTISTILYLLSAYGYYGLMIFIWPYLKEHETVYTLSLWLGEFCLLFFMLCYRVFYNTAGVSLLLAIFGYVLSFSNLIIVLAFVPYVAWIKPHALLNIYYSVFLALPVPYCYGAWWLDKLIKNRKKQ